VWPTLASVSEQGIVQPFPVLQVMFEFQPKNTTNTTKLNEKLAHISKLLDFNLLFDVQMVVKGRSFGAHWPILVAASPVMAAFYESGLEGSPKSINIDDMEPEVFEQMLRFMYTGEAPELQEFAEDLFVAAEKYQLKFLKEECEQHLSTDISIDNAVRRLLLARDHSSSTLMESSLQFLSKHQEEIWTRPEWEELLTKNPKVFFMASQRICMRGIKRKL
jgi:speckle-type POZ protein